MGFRSYDPATGQFVSNDPAGLAGGDINLRTYVGNQPTDFIDPFGLKRQKKPSGGQSSGKKKPPPPVCVTCVLRQAAAAIGNTIGNAINGIGYAANMIGNGLQQWANDASNTLRNWPPRHRHRRPPGASGTGGGGTRCELPPQHTKLHNFARWRRIDEDRHFSGPQRHYRPLRHRPRQLYLLRGDAPLHHRLRELADGHRAAQTVTVTQQLSPNLDWSTFQLGAIDFGSTVVNVPAGRRPTPQRSMQPPPSGCSST